MFLLFTVQLHSKHKKLSSVGDVFHGISIVSNRRMNVGRLMICGIKVVQRIVLCVS